MFNPKEYEWIGTAITCVLILVGVALGWCVYMR